MAEEIKKKRGALPGNQLARTHGFYSKVLDEAERADYKRATEVEGIDAEIALMRVKLKSIVSRDPENLKLITHVVNALARLIITKFNINKSDKKGLTEAVENVLKDIIVPLSSSIGSIFKK